MADVSLTAVTVEANAGEEMTLTAMTESTVSTAQNAVCDYPTDGKFIVVVKNANTTADKPVSVAVKAGFGLRAGLGDYTVSVPSEGKIYILGNLESARFKQSTGKLKLTITPTTGQALTTTSVGVFLLPF